MHREAFAWVSVGERGLLLKDPRWMGSSSPGPERWWGGGSPEPGDSLGVPLSRRPPGAVSPARPAAAPHRLAARSFVCTCVYLAKGWVRDAESELL